MAGLLFVDFEDAETAYVCFVATSAPHPFLDE